jgi:GNAT superfamily N-acetyltransferase
MTSADVKHVRSLEMKWKAEGISWGLFIDPKRIRTAELSKAIVFIAKDGKRSVGFVEGSVKSADGDMPAWNIKKHQCIGEVDSLYVSSRYRGRGVASRLMDCLLEEFTNCDVDVIRLAAANRDLVQITKFYKRFGFHARMVQMVAFPPFGRTAKHDHQPPTSSFPNRMNATLKSLSSTTRRRESPAFVHTLP